MEHELVFDATTNTALVSNSWISMNIPLASFTNLTTRGHLAQLIISGDLGTVYIDNILFHDGTTSIADNSNTPVPAMLGNSYPNPFKPNTNISYSVAKSAHVTLKIYDVKGRLVETLVDAQQAANSYAKVWNADNAAPGVYFYRLTVNGQAVDTKRMVLLK
ncbi:MAG: T9SS type A sorting domain-containing protein [Candidatus Cloacimonetes bacterium]|nr:T9SS type A sorting domain-containing protein [Candidatus Cloacimonadota bacterium]